MRKIFFYWLVWLVWSQKSSVSTDVFDESENSDEGEKWVQVTGEGIKTAYVKEESSFEIKVKNLSLSIDFSLYCIVIKLSRAGISGFVGIKYIGLDQPTSVNDHK